ncbi:virulence factor Mce family protein [Saccharopolyspora kobensis]|uniref:Virulence factor Mce family protein n=1 Tax=Saccharopolyspora kobensis TaxID=146035 RepID=A0A1H6EI08_9PSEU|nr:MCE family protein [Saccharopolyspora kobensis]SEG96475.1 virulence factor Mce family protein [Saccharopolyspora kobensis]SFF07285.1 virulence factor Mce family protein [Saccharopolyspora kobensis]
MRGDEKRRRYQALGVAFLIAAGMFFAGTIAVYRKAFTPVVAVSLETDRIGNQMRVGADVKARGVVVGEVRDVRAVGDHAVLELALKPDQAELIPAGSSARLLPKTLFGERYVALQIPAGGGSQALADGDVIPQDRSSSAIEVEKVLDELMPVLQAVQPEKLSTTLTAVSQALDGRGEQLGDTLVQLDSYLEQLNPSLPKLESVIARIDDVADTYHEAVPDLAQALGDLTTTSRTLAEQRTQLQHMIGSVTTSAESLDRFLALNKDNLINLTSSSRSTLELLAEYSPQYPCMLKQFADSIPTAEASFGKGTENPEIAKFTIEITGSRGKYLPGVDDPKYLDQRGPRCYPWVEPPDTFPQYPPGGPVEDGSTFPEPPRDRDEVFPWAAPASTAPQSVANAPAERELLSTLLAPQLGVAREDVPGWSGLLVGPVYRGAEVEVR